MDDHEARLTKKQKKGLAFREKRRRGDRGLTLDDGAFPVAENLDGIEAAAEAASPSYTRKRKTAENPVLDVLTDEPKTKKAKIKHGHESSVVSSRQDTPKTSQTKNADGMRFILFVGNLRFTTAKEKILAHFAMCDPPPTVRLLTPKAGAKPTNKSKGCAFVEFTHRNALQQGLKLHQSELDGRRINVELTAGGGGKGSERLEKLRTRNKSLADQRRIKLEQQVKDGNVPLVPETPQRYSTTSGLEQISPEKRTWTVGDDAGAHTKRRGDRKGKKHRARDLGTGVNAIPVG